MDPPRPGPITSMRARWAADATRNKIFHEMKKIHQMDDASYSTALAAVPTAQGIDDLTTLGSWFNFDPESPDHLPPDPTLLKKKKDPDWKLPPPMPGPYRVGIIGAGVTGLYIARILDKLAIPELTYEILEAAPRAGGRMFTHKFSETDHDYYDIGAMRYPMIKIMHRTFKLFDELEIPMRPYFLTKDNGAVKCPTMYNDITWIAGEDQPKEDPFRVSRRYCGGSVPIDKVDKVDQLLQEAFGPFKDALQKNWKKGFELLKTVDDYSTREYLKNPPLLKDPETGEPLKVTPNPANPLDFFTIQWLETNNTASGLFDQAFSESVIDSFDFDAPMQSGTDYAIKDGLFVFGSDEVKQLSTNQADPPPPASAVEDWMCIEGGTHLVTKAMQEGLGHPVELNKRVKKIESINKGDSTVAISVHVVGEDEPRAPYDTVFNTTSLGCLQRMDLTNLTLFPSQKDAIRCLHYDDSAKAAIRFKYPWWIKDCGITTGGVGSTDLPIRTCVYPSYNIKDPQTEPSVLLCSYTWSQDAIRVGSLMDQHALPDQRADPKYEAELKELLIDNLARLHHKNYTSNPEFGPGFTLEQVRKRIGDAYDTHHAFSWSHDPFTSGAFALFGPGQFRHLYPYLSRPTAGSLFHICGEASSAHHAWIVGSLDSAYASVQRFLKRFGLWHYLAQLEKDFGDVPEVEDDVDGTLHLQVALGMLPEDLMIRA